MMPEAMVAGGRAAELLERSGVFAVRVVAGARSGKTSLILATIDALRDEFNIGVVFGPDAGDDDLEHMRMLGIPAVVLDGDDPSGNFADFEMERLDLVLLEQRPPDIAKLATSAPFALTVAVFAAADIIAGNWGDAELVDCADAVVANKVDVIQKTEQDVADVLGAVRSVCPDSQVFAVAATKGLGVEEWAGWLAARVREAQGF